MSETWAGGGQGYSVWARTHRGRSRGPATWVWSTQPAHPALVDGAVFWAIHDRLHPDPEHAEDDDQIGSEHEHGRYRDAA
jgi:hypothetical protein